MSTSWTEKNQSEVARVLVGRSQQATLAIRTRSEVFGRLKYGGLTEYWGGLSPHLSEGQIQEAGYSSGAQYSRQEGNRLEGPGGKALGLFQGLAGS